MMWITLAETHWHGVLLLLHTLIYAAICERIPSFKAVSVENRASKTAIEAQAYRCMVCENNASDEKQI